MSESTLEFCELPLRPAPVLPTGLTQDRMDAIVLLRAKWVNGTTLHYYFFDRHTDGRRSTRATQLQTFVSLGREQGPQQDVVTEAFAEWQALGIGLRVRRGRPTGRRRRSASGSCRATDRGPTSAATCSTRGSTSGR